MGVSDYKDVTDVKSMKTGEQVFQAQCTACHTSGAVGAPKLGDEAAWGPRIKTGFDALIASALKGKGNMPPQGGGDASDFEIGRAVVFMANKSGAKFDEPKAPAPRRAPPTNRPSRQRRDRVLTVWRCRRRADRQNTHAAANTPMRRCGS